jgi:hypothetical protein
VPRWAPRLLAWHRGELALAEGPAPPGRPAGATVGPNVNVTANAARIESESFVAIDHTDPQRLIAAANWINGANQACFWSADGGRTWTGLTMPLGGADFHSDPGVAWDSRGMAYQCALAIAGNQAHIQVVRSGDGGRTWSAPEFVHTSRGNDKELMAVNAVAGAACPDLVCVSWSDLAARSLHAACATAGTAPWADRVLATGSHTGSVPAFGPDGEVWVSWQNMTRGEIAVAGSADCGQTWSPVVTVAPLRASFDIGIVAMCDRRVLIYPALDVDRSGGPRRGHLYVAWNDAAPGSNCPPCVNPPCACSTACNTDVFFARSEDGGQTWSAPVAVHERATEADQFNPWLAVDDTDGAVRVMWYDTRSDPARRRSDVYFRESADGGLSWSGEVLVTTAPSDETTAGADPNQYGDYNGLATFACRSFPIWTDRRSGASEQIYTARVDSGGAPPPDLGNALRAVADPALAPLLSWSDLGAGEVDYRVYRGDDPDFATIAPALLGSSGGGDVVAYLDATAPATPGVSFYKVRGLGPCAAELTTW